MKDKEYRAHPALNVSRLALMAQSPRHFQLDSMEETEAMRFGTIIHMAMLEPKRFKELYVVEPSEINGQPRNNRLKAHREFIAQWREEQASDAVILSPDQMDSLIGMINSMAEERGKPLLEDSINLADIFNGAQTELPIIREFNGRQCKGKADIVTTINGQKWVFDIKKVGRKGDASPKAFKRIISNLHYDAKAAWYQDLFEATNFGWIVIEEKAPYAIAIYDAEPFYDIGKLKYQKWMEKLKDCEKSGRWDWYTRGCEKIYPTDWTIKEHEEENWT